MKTIPAKKIGQCLAVFLLLAGALAGADARQNPVKASYCDGSSMDIYPYSAVIRSDGSTFNCYEVQVSPIAEGLRFGFEDADDFDYNDIIIDLSLSANGSGAPVAHVRFVSMDAAYSHAIHLVYGGNDLELFNSKETSPGTVFDIPLPVRACPDFVLSASPAAQSIAAGGTVLFQVKAEGSNGFNQPLSLSLNDSPTGFSHSFQPNPLNPGSSSVLEIKTTAQTVPGIYPLTITAAGGGISHALQISVEIKPFIPGDLEKSFSLLQAYPGQQVEMTLLLKNNSVNDFHDISLWDELPAQLVYQDDDATPKAELSGRKISWFFRRLNQGEKIRIKVKLKVADSCPPMVLYNQGYFQHSLLLQPMASNTAIIRIEAFQIQLQKTVNRNQARPGDTLDYQIQISNPAEQPLPAARLKDLLATELEFVSQQSDLAFQQQGNTLLWSGDIAAGQETSVLFTARIRDNSLAGTRIDNSARLESNALAETLLSNTVSTTVVSDPIATSQVHFSKKVNTPQSEVGRIILFRLLMENRSPSILLAPWLEDFMPQGFTYVPGSSECDGVKLADPQGNSRLTWQIPVIRSGQTSIVSYQAVIGADARRGRNINRAVFNAQDPSGQNLRLEAEEFINVSTSSIVFFCGVEGSVYLDRDGNELFTPADTPLTGIEVRLSNGQQARTDTSGRYVFQSLFPGEYALGINRATLPEKYRVVPPATKAVTLFDGLTDTIDFAVTFKNDDEVPTSRLEGRVFFDKIKNQVFDSGEPLLVDFTVMLDDSLQTTGKEGSFVFSKLPPGKHRLAITYSNQTIRREIVLPAGKTSLDIPLPFSAILITVKGEN
jgi:uncharacterized repeat protein (TIGR01451 family)